LRAPRRHRALVERRVRWILDVGIALLWLRQAFDRFELLVPTREIAGKVLDARLQLGDLDVSLGRVLGFPVVLVGAYFLARIIVFVLEEDVYSRMALPRGVPYALSSLTRYGLLLLGFFLALGSLGFDLTRLTVLVSAFGLGIGFGLQQVVNNFVSGLILLFERPIQVGDAVQLGDMLGEVTRIGIRSSTVRTLEGAEVIVPNSNMLEEKVTNWTLSDRKRRVDVNVGVAYGTDAAAVITLLQGVAGQNQQVVQEPAPEAFFVGFGDSSLDFQLRVWTDSPGWLRLKSEIGVALQRALAEAEIEVPFPQRDLNVRSVAPSTPR
jgi:small-conductance mechanosensitive channel